MAHADGVAPRLRIRIALDAGPHRVESVDLVVDEGATVAEAICASGLRERHLHLDLDAFAVAVWGRLRGATHPLRDRDRIELLRPLQVDPMEARRRRQAGQRSAR
ncbi:MAG: RnfH family protein [Burkholderiaceae bacterium]